MYSVGSSFPASGKTTACTTPAAHRTLYDARAPDYKGSRLISSMKSLDRQAYCLDHGDTKLHPLNDFGNPVDSHTTPYHTSPLARFNPELSQVVD